MDFQWRMKNSKQASSFIIYLYPFQNKSMDARLSFGLKSTFDLKPEARTQAFRTSVK
jgi:hypothetical protein